MNTGSVFEEGASNIYFHNYNQVAYNIVADKNIDGEGFDLLLAASCNVRIQGTSGVDIVDKDNVSILSVSQVDDATEIDALDNNLSLKFRDKLFLGTNLSYDSEASALVTQTGDLDVVASNVNVVGTLNVAQNFVAKGSMVTENNFLCRRSIFGSNINIYNIPVEIPTSSDDLVSIGYGFRMNPEHQLELVKTAHFFDSNIVSQRIAIFGTGAITRSGSFNDTMYMAFDELKGLGIGTGASNSQIVFSNNGNVIPTDMDFQNIYSLCNVHTVTSGSFSGDGSSITNLNAGNVASGTLPVSRGGTGTTTSTGTGSVVLNESPTITGTLTADSFAGVGAKLFQATTVFYRRSSWINVVSDPFTLGNGTKHVSVDCTSYSIAIGNIPYTLEISDASSVVYTHTFLHSFSTICIPIHMVQATNFLISGLAQGTYTMKISSSSANIRVDANDYLDVVIIEYPF